MNELDKFLFILCLSLGKTKAELLSTLSSYELHEWLLFYQINPFGIFRADIQAGIIASTIANVNRGSNTKEFTPEDFLPKFEEKIDNKQQTVEQMVAGIQLYMGAIPESKEGKEGN
jgi:hypothetical protein